MHSLLVLLKLKVIHYLQQRTRTLRFCCCCCCCWMPLNSEHSRSRRSLRMRTNQWLVSVRSYDVTLSTKVLCHVIVWQEMIKTKMQKHFTSEFNAVQCLRTNMTLFTHDNNSGFMITWSCSFRVILTCICRLWAFICYLALCVNFCELFSPTVITPAYCHPKISNSLYKWNLLIRRNYLVTRFHVSTTRSQYW